MNIFSACLLILYMTAAILLMLYGMNCYIMIALFQRSRLVSEKISKDVREKFGNLTEYSDLPMITTQIPVYNELNVVERVMRAVCRMEYPDDLHDIQVLDDSTDETRELIDKTAALLRSEGHRIRVIRREHRTGYKAGALANGLPRARGELIAIFDADFVPPEKFLVESIPFFLADKQTGFVQARWGHLNRQTSLLTRAQSIGIDGHFMVEQAARNRNGLFMNFNGTAGLWRKEAIQDGGGWQWDTLTEDMDLSYRVQFAGWNTVFLSDLIVPAEIPEDVSAFKSQQFRWAKGSVQTALKLLPQLWRMPIPFFKKLQSFFHLTHYLVHPLMLILALFALPVLLTCNVNPGKIVFTLIAFILLFAMTAPSAIYLVSQRAAYPKGWFSRILCMPVLILIGVGVAVSNSRAVFEAVTGKKSEFVRTPKRGAHEKKHYSVRLPRVMYFEILMGCYCAGSLGYYLFAGKFLIGPFLAVYAAGFLFIGLLTLFHTIKVSK
ncbi:glycosyltransferase [Desulfobacterales bacterium HSG2]|nr:glycosyltransferase [Desulfobacterales bacterium HSG2]